MVSGEKKRETEMMERRKKYALAKRKKRTRAVSNIGCLRHG